MFAFLDANWGGWLAGTGVTLMVYALQSSIPKPSRLLTLAVFLLGIFSLFAGVYLLFPRGSAAPPDSSPTLPSPKTPLPTTQPQTAPPAPLGKILPPETIVNVQPIQRGKDTSFMLANWASSAAKNIEITAWANLSGRLDTINVPRVDYLGPGDNVNFSLPALLGGQPLALCLSYLVNGYQVGIVHFFSNREGAGYRRSRDSIPSADNNRRLCNTPPPAVIEATAGSGRAAKGEQYCININGKNICE